MFSSFYSLLSSLKNLNILSDKHQDTSLLSKSHCLTKKQLGCVFTGEKSVSKESSLLALANNSLTAGRNSRAHKRTDGQQHKSSVLSTAYQEGPAHEDQAIEIDDENEAENTGKPQGGWGMTVFSALNPSVVTTGMPNHPFLKSLFCISCLATKCSFLKSLIFALLCQLWHTEIYLLYFWIISSVLCYVNSATMSYILLIWDCQLWYKSDLHNDWKTGVATLNWAHNIFLFVPFVPRSLRLYTFE